MSASERRTAALPPYVVMLIGVLAVAIFAQGGYYATAQILVGLGLALGTLAALRTRGPPWPELRQAPIAACGALAGWALIRATLGGEPGNASGYVLLLAGVVAVIVVCQRATRSERDVLIDALIALAVVAALSGLVGVAWHYSPWALELGGVWRAATTLTYMNAGAGLLVPVGLLALGRLADHPTSPVRAAAACVVLAGAAATLSRAGALTFVVGATVLAGLVGPRRLARAAGPPVLGAAIAWAGLLPSIVNPRPAPAIAVGALVAGIAVAAGLARASDRRVRRVGLVAVVAATVAIGVAAVAGGGLGQVSAARLRFTEPERGAAGAVALRVAEQHPLDGAGPRQVTLAWAGPGDQTLVARYAHNEYLQVLAELGVIGLALLVGLIAALALQVWRARRAASPGLWAGTVAALVAAAVHGGFDFLWHVPAVVLVCVTLAGVANPTKERVGVGMKRLMSGWYEHSHALVARKLGACPRCMRASLGIAIAAWGAYVVARAVSGAALVHTAALVVAGASTILFAAHVAAFYVRVTRSWRVGSFAAGPDGTRGHNRRRFFVTSGALLAGALLAPLSRVFGAPVLAKKSPPLPCECAGPDPKQPAAKCPSCRCKTKGDPKKPTAPCSKTQNAGATTTTTASGTCAGSLSGCGGNCTRTFTWTCAPENKNNTAFHWQKTGQADDCPTAGKPANQTTTSTGKCQGQGCNPKGAQCGKKTTWTCDPHAGEGNDPNGRWTGTTVDDPACPV